MVSSIVKLLALAAAVLGPFIGGYVTAHTIVVEASWFFALAGSGIGIAGLLVFASIDRGERRAHARARNLVRGA
ncbi:hypothetical protein [Bosea sp. BK604]|uniref:hypothetical protein n=1 Tax=Bosea sp. BK604 TaxID=2512180 RepID=UPI0010464533|nr:hypothetical protein [Bosea sp. BK604]TCR70495.1 hypothetical protein EV560_101902 [Bosea sp. BK604]